MLFKKSNWREEYNAPHEAAVRSITQNLINAGLIKTRSVDEAVEKQEYKKFYMHRTGHWLGLDVHDVVLTIPHSKKYGFNC